MECTAGTKSDLLLLYRQEKMGTSQWQCMEELIHIIQQDVIEFPTVSASVSISDTPNTISILDNEFAIYSWIRKIMISTSDSEIIYGLQKFLQNIYIISFRSYMKHHIRGWNIFSLLQNQNADNTLDNLKKISILKPAMFVKAMNLFIIIFTPSVSEEKIRSASKLADHR